jgi:hypothetical protein
LEADQKDLPVFCHPARHGSGFELEAFDQLPGK